MEEAGKIMGSDRGREDWLVIHRAKPSTWTLHAVTQQATWLLKRKREWFSSIECSRVSMNKSLDYESYTPLFTQINHTRRDKCRTYLRPNALAFHIHSTQAQQQTNTHER